ncbi:COG0714 MoxR-like ATPases [uncultured Caudovirales phage]|uniref:COG0714 MoxR-like ATPases n=1 Tax=uncultured Caudovirales phage TaxID=2100421 RepID=A0A6J5LFD3_9CAUD|nr:COG0714 MoxR-like ATPases [uncultured Caudovirales phage]
MSEKAKVEDLVKTKIKEAMEKRKVSAELHPIITDELAKLSPEDVTKPVRTRPELKPNQTYFSDLFKELWIIDKEDFGVTMFSETTWDERIKSFVPSINPAYVIDKDLAANVLRAWELNERVLCYGPTGAGKSSLIEQLCAHTGRPFVRVNCTGDMDTSMIFGQLTAKDGSTIWVDGAVTEAVRYGAVFAWDEWDVTPPEISMGLQWLLEDEGKLFLKEMPGSTKDKQIVPHEHFRIVAIGNTQGQGDDTGAHAGTNVQNSATLDRFGTAIYVDYLEASVEEKMLTNKFPDTITKKAAKELVKLANLIRQGYKANQFNLTMSPRSLFSICNKVSFGMSLRAAFNLVYLNKLNDTQRKVADELFTKIYGNKDI